MEKLQEWQRKYENSRDAFQPKIQKMLKSEKQYEGNLQPETGEEVKCIYNFTKELIESAIDTTIPLPKVEPRIKTEKNKRLARIIEAMLISQIKCVDIEPLNDSDERTTKIMGGDVALVEWDNSVITPSSTGEIDIRLISPARFTPQDGVYRLKDMDYFFLDFEDTKERIKKNYGVDVEDETVDRTVTDEAEEADTVTQVWAFYKNNSGGIGVFSWAGDTVIIDDDKYQARAEEVCAECGAPKQKEKHSCLECGSRNFERKHLEYETLTEDIVLSDGTIIPAEDYAVDEAGNYLKREVERQTMEIDPMTGTEIPAYNYIFDELGMVVGSEPKVEVVEEVYKEPTRIPYYTPKKYPASIRQNISSLKSVFGSSDAEDLKEAQLEANKQFTIMLDKMKHSGYALVKGKGTELTFTNGIQTLEIEAADELSMIQALNLSFDISKEVMIIDKIYLWAKSILGINDSAQGKADPTAVSGRAKEAQISRALARQGSKAIMKNAFYKDIYTSMFQYALAYMDEPRKYSSPDEKGEETEYIFNRYDFLEKGAGGKWTYNDQFVIEIDQMAGAAENREVVLEMMLNDFSAGLYGNPQEAETVLQFWKDRESMNYPNAKRQVARWQKKVEEAQKALEMQQKIMAEQAGAMPEGVPQIITEGDPGVEVEDEM